MQDPQLIEAIFTCSRLMKEEMCYDTDLLHLTMLQMQVLIYIHRHPGSQMSEIALYFKIELPSATSLITKLKSLQLIERKADEKDRRLVKIFLTKKGENLFSDAMKERSKKIAGILKQLRTEDKKSLLEILQRLIISMEKNYEK